MKIVDLSHLMNVHTPGWVGYAGNQMYYAQNLQTKMIVTQRIDSSLHVGTHIDGAMHGTDGMGDMASYPLDFLVSPGAVVDVSQHMDDWAVITPKMIESAPVAVKDGDILIIHTGWHRYWEGQPVWMIRISPSFTSTGADSIIFGVITAQSSMCCETSTTAPGLTRKSSG